MELILYTELRDYIEIRLNIVDEKVKSFPRNKFGLVEVTDKYLKAKKDFDRVFNELRTLNKHTPNKVKRQYSKLKREKAK